MIHRFDRWLGVAAGVMLLLLLAQVGVALHRAGELRDRRVEQLHSHEVLASLGNVLSLLKDAETGQRGFLITGEERYLGPFDGAAGAVENAIDTVARLTADDPRQQAEMLALRADALAKLSELSHTIDLRRRAGFDAARALVAEDHGKALMDTLRARIAAMQAHERALLADRTARAERSYAQSRIGAVLGGVAVGIGALALFMLVRRHDRARLAAARTIAEQGELLRVTLHSIGDGVIATDVEGRVTQMNPVAESLTGWRIDDARGTALSAVFAIVNEHTRAPVDNPALRALREGVIVGLANHTVLIARDGVERPIDDSAAPIRAANGTPLGSVLVFRDISERHAAELDAARRQQQLRLVTDHAPVLIAQVDAARRYKFVNRPYAALFASEPEQLIGRTMADVLGERAYALARPKVDAVLDGHAVEHELELIDRPGPAPRVLRAAYAPERDAGGAVVGFIAALSDVTARKAAQRLLHEGELRLRLAMEAAALGAWQWNLSTGEMVWSPETYRLMGVAPGSTVTSATLEACLHPDDRARNRQATEAALASGRYEIDYRIVKPDGALCWIAARGRVVGGEQGAGQRMLGVISDITERQALQQAQRDEARRKDEFLATLAHELRNPLAPIRNGVAMMKLAPADAALHERTRAMIERQLDHLVRLVDDLLDLSRISQGVLQLRRGRIELASALHRAVEASRPLADACAHRLEVTLPAEPIYLDADPVRLAQVFSNLINNACRYTPRGGLIDVRAARRGADAEISISDNGIGIERAQLTGIFEMFSQLAPARERSESGLGIGLALVQRLVALHRGSVQAHSDGAGRGARFVVRLPAEAQAVPEAPLAAPPDAAPVPSIGRRRFLIVDDNADSADSLSMLISLLGHECHTARDGLAAVEAAARLRPDVVLLDIGLPLLSGFDACARMRAAEDGAKPARIVAVTGWGQDKDVRMAREAGFDAHLVKPIDIDELLRLLEGLLASNGRPVEGAQA